MSNEKKPSCCDLIGIVTGRLFVRVRGTGKQVDFAYEMRGGMESRYHLSVIARSMHSWDVTEGDHPKAWK